MEFRTALGKAMGLGPARSGTHHWWMQRITAVALIPLTLWLVWFLSRLVALDHPAMLAWLGRPWNSAMLLAYVCAACYHAQLGLREVIVDYVQQPAVRTLFLIGVWMVLAFLVLLAFVSTVKILAGG